MGSEPTTTVKEPAEEQATIAQSDQNDAENSISTVSKEKVNDRDAPANDKAHTRKRVWSDYVPSDAYERPKSLEGRLSYYMENLNDWLKMKEKLRLKALLKILHKSHNAIYVSRWVGDCNALFRMINRINRRKPKV